MKKIYENNELNFALIWIGVYVILLSVGDNVSGMLGIAKVITAPVSILLTMILYKWIAENALKEKYGLCSFEGDLKEYLYFIPLALLVLPNLWWGVQLNFTVYETILYIVSMLCVGFLEEVIFRGFLFKALCRENVQLAFIISSVTFGIGHIVNLLNGKDIAETLMQVCYAVAAGFLFTLIFYNGKSLWPCILAHSFMNSFSVFANEAVMTIGKYLGSCIYLCVVSVGYACYIQKKISKDRLKTEFLITYDKETQKAVMKCSICNGEQVVGFKNIQTGEFSEVMLIRNEKDLEEFKKVYGVEQVSREY